MACEGHTRNVKLVSIKPHLTPTNHPRVGSLQNLKRFWPLLQGVRYAGRGLFGDNWLWRILPPAVHPHRCSGQGRETFHLQTFQNCLRPPGRGQQRKHLRLRVWNLRISIQPSRRRNKDDIWRVRCLGRLGECMGKPIQTGDGRQRKIRPKLRKNVNNILTEPSFYTWRQS